MKWVGGGGGWGLKMLPSNLLSPLLKSKTKCILSIKKTTLSQLFSVIFKVYNAAWVYIVLFDFTITAFSVILSCPDSFNFSV